MTDMDPELLKSMLRLEVAAADAANGRAARWKKRYEEQAAIVEAAKAAVRLMQPDHLTPTGARHILSTLEAS